MTSTSFRRIVNRIARSSRASWAARLLLATCALCGIAFETVNTHAQGTEILPNGTRPGKFRPEIKDVLVGTGKQAEPHRAVRISLKSLLFRSLESARTRTAPAVTQPVRELSVQVDQYPDLIGMKVGGKREILSWNEEVGSVDVFELLDVAPTLSQLAVPDSEKPTSNILKITDIILGHGDPAIYNGSRVTFKYFYWRYDAEKDDFRGAPLGTDARTESFNLGEGISSNLAQILAAIPGMKVGGHRAVVFKNFMNSGPMTAEVELLGVKPGVSRVLEPLPVLTDSESKVKRSPIPSDGIDETTHFQVAGLTEIAFPKVDVSGVRLGMPETEAKRILEAQGKNVRFENYVQPAAYLAHPEVESLSLVPRFGASKTGEVTEARMHDFYAEARRRYLDHTANRDDLLRLIPAVKIGAKFQWKPESNPGRNEALFYAIGESDPTEIVDIYEITTFDGKDRPSVDSLKKSLIERYGQTEITAGNGSTLIYFFDDEGNVLHPRHAQTPVGFDNESDWQDLPQYSLNFFSDHAPSRHTRLWITIFSDGGLFATSVEVRLSNIAAWVHVLEERQKRARETLASWERKTPEQITKGLDEPPQPKIASPSTSKDQSGERKTKETESPEPVGDRSATSPRSVFTIVLGEPLPEYRVRDKSPLWVTGESKNENWGSQEISLDFNREIMNPRLAEALDGLRVEIVDDLVEAVRFCSKHQMMTGVPLMTTEQKDFVITQMVTKWGSPSVQENDDTTILDWNTRQLHVHCVLVRSHHPAAIVESTGVAYKAWDAWSLDAIAFSPRFARILDALKKSKEDTARSNQAKPGL